MERAAKKQAVVRKMTYAEVEVPGVAVTEQIEQFG